MPALVKKSTKKALSKPSKHESGPMKVKEGKGKGSSSSKGDEKKTTKVKADVDGDGVEDTAAKKTKADNAKEGQKKERERERVLKLARRADKADANLKAGPGANAEVETKAGCTKTKKETGATSHKASPMGKKRDSRTLELAQSADTKAKAGKVAEAAKSSSKSEGDSKDMMKSISVRGKSRLPSPPVPTPSELSEPEGEEEVDENEEEEAESANSASDVGDDKQNEREDDSEEEDDDAPLRGFLSESDSSDEDDDDVDKAPIDVGKLPTVAKDDAAVKKKLERANRKPTEERGVLYLGRIPHGFYENQMKGYFSQFGEVTRLRLSRNKKTGRSKHYAFIEFKSAAVAQIVAETMDNYLLMGHLLKCQVIPKEEVHPELWIGANRTYRKVPTARIERIRHNKPRTDEQKRKVERRLLKRHRQKKRKLEALGIDYDLDAVSHWKKPKLAE